MLEQTPRREATTKLAGPASAGDKDRTRMFVALVLLLACIAMVLVKNQAIWLGAQETAPASDDSPVWNPNTPMPSAAAVPAAKPANHVAAKVSVKPPKPGRTVVATSHAVLPPLQVEVLGGDAHSNSVKITMSAPSTPVAAERVQMASEQTPVAPRSVEMPYPLLARQMKVQGSVLLQAFISADGAVRELRVLSGPPILASAAREAARGWKFRPYLQHGQAVETQATIAVNFTINVLNNRARDQETIARGGE